VIILYFISFLFEIFFKLIINNGMENSIDHFRKYHQERLINKSAPQVEMLRVMENLKRSVDFYNSYGLDFKHEIKKPLNESNQ
jgi:hypothetical protein